jgi:hypothetical protein
MKFKVAAEMKRVLAYGGIILWYDFMYNNPINPDVRGVAAKEIRHLFSGFEISLHRITLAPPIARKIPPKILPVLYPVIALIPFLRTHYLGIFKKLKSSS